MSQTWIAKTKSFPNTKILENYRFMPPVLQVKEQVKWKRPWFSDGVAEWLLSKARLSPWGSFRLERSVGFGYDLIIGNSRLSSNLSVHFIPEFCTNMYSSLNMKMTDINNSSCGTPLYPCDCGHTFARQLARVIQTILLEENTRKWSLKGRCKR